ncbi:MAG: gas vesicle protein K [Rhodoferax sp.]
MSPSVSGEGGPPAARVALDPQSVRKGLGQLVLTLVELLRQLLEKQALRRIEGGSLTPDEVERLGLTFLELDRQMQWLKKEFELTDEELNLDLGPLGKLL